jgi:hypothetical protein
MDLDGILQVASFHPQYQFAGNEADDVENYTNRAPWPTLHLLREDSVSKAVAAFPDPDVIVERNVETLRKLGVAGWRKLLDDERARQTEQRARSSSPSTRHSPGGRSSEGDAADRTAMQRVHMVADRREHARTWW